MTEFDLKKYLAQVSHMSGEELRDTVVKGTTVGVGLEEYLHEIHNAGAQIIASHTAEDEVDHLAAMVSGISCQKVIMSPDIPAHEKAILAALMTAESGLVKKLTLSVMCAMTGMVNKEEWR